MASKVIPIDAFDVKKLVLKTPTPLTSDGSVFISEVWYKEDGKPYKPILQTPRIRLRYGAKAFDNGNVTYALSTYNSDIDDEIAAFFALVKAIDTQVSRLFMRKRTKWEEFLPVKRIRYWSSLKKKNGTPYMQLKMITDGGDTLTTISDTTGRPRTIEQLTYGLYTNQLIGMAYVYYTSDGVHPVWQSHQVVVSKAEKVFLDVCLLTSLRHENSPPQNLLPQPPPPPSFENYTSPLAQAPQQQPRVGVGLAAIKATELQAMLGKLRHVEEESEEEIEEE
ncbi:MAG: hypothetical protein EBT18_07555 [Gammaproteobacteria bacterium]|nr:hypothetical protein [Gammaproteobacteria bacterium]